MRSSGTKDSRNVINIISGIAAAGVAIGSLAMIHRFKRFQWPGIIGG